MNVTDPEWNAACIRNWSGVSSFRIVLHLYQMSAQSLVRFVAERGVPVPVHERRAEVTILDRVANAASVRVDASTWIEYLHLCKWNARWVIIDSLWVKPAAP
jgi:hypothetical protein